MLEALKEVQLTDEQVKALDHFFTEHTENIRSEIESNYEDKIKELEEQIEHLKSNQINENDENIKLQSEKAFHLFKRDAEKAFELFKKDAEKAFELYKADLKNQYSENMVEALQKLYIELEERVKEDFKQSEEYKTFKKFVDIAKPLVLKEKQEIFEKLEMLKNEKERLEKEKKELSKKEIINTLLESFPKEHVEEVRTFLEGAQTEDEIYERFQTIGKTIEKLSVSKKTTERKTNVVENNENAKVKERKLIFESNTTQEPKIVTQKPKQEITVEDYIYLLNSPSLI